MKVHLIKSAELDKELFTQIVYLLQAIPGPIEFLYSKNSIIDFEKEELSRKIYKTDREFSQNMLFKETSFYSINFPIEKSIITWDILFKKCNDYRKTKTISNQEFVILLTDLSNEKNWFAAIDDTMPFNGFVHADDWSYYIDCPQQFPIAYEVIALLLHHYSIKNLYEFQNQVHERSIGCVNDFCLNKKDIILKLRTADICSNCMSKLKDRLSITNINHALSLLESFRVKMLFAQNFKQESPLSKMIFDKSNKIFLTDYENIEIKLTPLEKCLYMLFLNYPEGIYLSSLFEHKEELYRIYTNLSNLGDLHEMRYRIDDMVNVLTDSASQKISKIKKTFETVLGTELAKNYYIKGGNAEVKKISLDRSLIQLVKKFG